MLSYDYLSLIKDNLLPLAAPRYKPKGLKGLITCHPTYREDLQKAVAKLNEYFKIDSKDSSPLNCLILGPPGAGKTFLATQLAKGIKKPLIEHNVSLSSDPKAMLEELAKHAGEPKMVFIDEFDVTIGGSSVVRFLLDAMTSKKHHQTAFVFSGSYLKNKLILERLNSNLSDFDFPLFLFRLLAKTQDEGSRKQILQLYQACCLYQENRQTLSPDADLIHYLRQLHKLRDFLSRINGFIVQIPDLASPMMISDHALKLKSSQQQPDKSIRLLDPKTAEYVKTFIEDAEKPRKLSWTFDNPNKAIFQFKNMLLTERLGMMRIWLDELVQREGGGKKTFFMRRQDLNYLAMVPLQHNVRSLRFLIEQCLEPSNDKLTQQDLKLLARYVKDPHRLVLNTESAALHIVKEPFFGDAATLWAFVKAANSPDIGDGEALICLSEIPNVLTVLLFGADRTMADNTKQSLQDTELLKKDDESLFAGIQLIPVVGKGCSADESVNATADLDKNTLVIEQPCNHDPTRQEDRLSLLSRAFGTYTLLVDAGDLVGQDFVREALKVMKDKDNDPPSFVMARSKSFGDSVICETHEIVPTQKDGKPVPRETEHSGSRTLVYSDMYSSSRPMLCKTRDLKELVTLDADLTWPFDGSSHLLQDPKTVQEKCKVLEILEEKSLFTANYFPRIVGAQSRQVRITKRS